VSLHPEQTALNRGLCPACGKPLTVGVLNRVCQLADRPPGGRPSKAHPFLSLVPLESLLSEVLGAGPGSKKVQQAYEGLLADFGPELFILKDLDPAELERQNRPLLAEAIRLMRQGRVQKTGGFDGVFGSIKVLPEKAPA
jgi:PHP family Zn ribbon phosphoesterase